jgi:hypothetical protein
MDSSRNASFGLGKILQESPSTLVRAPNPPTSRASSLLAGTAESKEATIETSPVTCPLTRDLEGSTTSRPCKKAWKILDDGTSDCHKDEGEDAQQDSAHHSP